jgi:hypothetical protein
LGAAIVLLGAVLMSRPLGPVVWERVRSLSLVRTRGQVTGCEVGRDERDLPVLRLAYQYQYDGRALRGNHWREPPLFIQRADYETLCRGLTVGRSIDVYVDPQKPEVTTLEHGFSGQDVLSLLLFLDCLALAAVFGWAGFRGSAPGSPRSAAVVRTNGRVLIHNSAHVGGLTFRLLVAELWVLPGVLAIGWGKEPSMTAIGGGIAIVAAVAVATYAAERRRHDNGTGAIVIDRAERTVTTPKRLGQSRYQFSVDDVRRLAIFPVRWMMEHQSGVTFAVGAFASSQADEVFMMEQMLALDHARELVRLLAHEINDLRPERAIEAPSDPVTEKWQEEST